MTENSTPPSPPETTDPGEIGELVAQARHGAQDRVAELHIEEGTVKSEDGQNSPSPEDHD